MRIYDDIGANESLTVEVWNNLILHTVAPLLRANGERTARDGSLSVLRFDRQRNLYAIEAQTASPLFDPYLSPGSWGTPPVTLYTSVSGGVQWQFCLSVGGKLRRVTCFDGDGNTDENVAVWKTNGSGVWASDYLAPTNAPFDTSNLDITVTAGDFVNVAVVTAGNILSPVRFRVALYFALNFDTGIS